MPRTFMRDLAEGTEFYLLLQAKPPRVLHWSAGLSVALLSVGLLWAATTRVNLVVRAPGRVRPLSPPLPVRMGARAEVLSASLGGRVVEVDFSPGQTVRRNDVLVRLDTERLDVEMSRKRHALADLEKEAEQLEHQAADLAEELAEASKRAEAELFQAEESVKQKKIRQDSDVRALQLQEARSEEEMKQTARLHAVGAVSKVEAEGARLRHLELKEKLLQAKLPIDNQPVEIARRALRVLRDQYAGKQTELRLKLSGKLKEHADTLKDMESLSLERAQAEIRAPVSGIVTQGEVKVGAILQPQQVIVEIAEQNGFLFELEVSNEDLGHLRVGMPARIKLDPYDFQKYGVLEGNVSFISPDSSLGDKSGRATYRVLVQPEADEVRRGELRGPVKLGMTGQAELIVDEENLLSVLLKRVRQRISLK
jgi:hemolysin D